MRFFTGKTYCSGCRCKIDWYCIYNNGIYESVSFPIGIQLFHDRKNGKDIFEGLCDRNHRIVLPECEMSLIPEEFFVNP